MDEWTWVVVIAVMEPGGSNSATPRQSVCIHKYFESITFQAMGHDTSQQWLEIFRFGHHSTYMLGLLINSIA